MKASKYNKNLPKFLHRTDKQIRMEQERQDAMKPPVFTYSETQVQYGRAITDEKTARESLELLEDTLENAEAIEHNKLKLAEAYLALGQFDLAYKIHPDERYREFLYKIVKAKKPCPHPKTKEYNEKRGNERNVIEIPTYRLWRRVFDNAPDKFINIYVCNECRAVWKDKS